MLPVINSHGTPASGVKVALRSYVKSEPCELRQPVCAGSTQNYRGGKSRDTQLQLGTAIALATASV